MIDLLTALADKSLVVAEERHAQTRYRLLETLREYAQDRLRECGTKRRGRRHVMHFVALAEAAEPKLWGAASEPGWTGSSRNTTTCGRR